MNPPPVDRQTFLDNLRRSGLLGTRELNAVTQKLPKTDRGRAVARTLVEWGVLTKFQAELLLIGRTGGFVLGQYQILDYLGAGGIGRVYKAMHRTMKRVVALKILAPQLVKTEKAHKLFKHEVRAAARLVHPNIVTAFDANKLGGRHYLVMEYVDGPNLDQLVRERGPLPVGLACELMRQAAAGLQYAFEMGMVHRDVKPANLLVQRSPPGNPGQTPVLKILDFGLARLHTPGDDPARGNGTIATADNTVMGTPDYLSPEQSRNLHETDIRSDLYSLGCTFYYLLTAKVPFPGGTSLEKLIRHTREEPTPVEQHRPELPPVVCDIVRRLMAKDPAARFQTPAELADALAPLSTTAPASSVGLGRLRQAVSPPAGQSGPDSSLIELGAPPATASAQAGLESTWPPDLSPTPLSARSLPQVQETPPRTSFALKVLALCLTLGMVAAVAGAVGFLLASR